HNQQGIYLKPLFLFRVFHPPVLIPWQEIQKVDDQKMFFQALKFVRIGQPHVVSLGLRPALFRKLPIDQLS
ncbi:MAG: hypothetical protein AAF206_14325, partial [Bacteroidota bacterium]